MVVAILGGTTFLDRSCLSPDVPLQDVARVGGTDDHVRLEGVENGLGNFVLRGESYFRSLPQTHRIQVNEAIRLVYFPLCWLAVAAHQ